MLGYSKSTYPTADSVQSTPNADMVINSETFPSLNVIANLHILTSTSIQIHFNIAQIILAV